MFKKSFKIILNYTYGLNLNDLCAPHVMTINSYLKPNHYLLSFPAFIMFYKPKIYLIIGCH